MVRRANTSHLKITGILVLVLVFVAGILALGSARESSPTAPGIASQTSFPAFTLATSRTLIPAGERERLLSTQERFQRSDGIYKLVQTIYGPDGTKKHVQTLFGYIGLGVFRLDEAQKRLAFTGPQIDDRPADVGQFLRAHELFTREESVAGISTVVWQKNGRAKGDLTEEYRAPSLDGLLVKSVKTTAHGRETLEPTAIQMGEPAPGLFSELLSYPVDYSDYERQVQDLEKNEPDIALVMRQLLSRVQQAKP